MDFGDDLFIRCVTKFCIQFEQPGQFIVDNVNTILNDLNSLPYKNVPAHDVFHAIKLLETLVQIPPGEETLVVKSCFLINALVKQQKVSLFSELVESLTNWLLSALKQNFNSVNCDIFNTLGIILRRDADKVPQINDVLFSPDGIIIKCLKEFNSLTPSTVHYDNHNSEDVKLSAILCLESFLAYFDESHTKVDLQQNCIINIGDVVLSLIYNAKEEAYGDRNYCQLMTSSLNICRIVTLFELDWGHNHLGDLIGAAKAFIAYKIENIVKTVPKTITVSQQPLFEQTQFKLNIVRGNVTKMKKPRNLGKLKSDETKKINVENVQNVSEFGFPSTSDGCTSGGDGEFLSVFSKYQRPSDSDFSETESKRVTIDLKRQAKLRQMAIVVIGTLAKTNHRHIFFGYWHALFPSGNSLGQSASLLNCLLRDPSPNSRIVACQTTAFILFGSKSLLSQADLSEKSLASFTPFSAILGNMIKLIYLTIADVLTTDGSLPVIIQTLKCLQVLVQNTAFEKLPAPIIKTIIQQVRGFLRHKDSNVNMAALIVMATIITFLEGVTEVSKILDIKVAATVTKNQSKYKVVKDELMSNNMDDDEIEITSENEEEDKITMEMGENNGKRKVPWLLEIIFENLGVTDCKYKLMSARNESLQVLSAMGLHFLYLKDYFEEVAIALHSILNDKNVELRLAAIKCLQSIANGGSSYLLTQDQPNPDEITPLLNLWITLLPSVTKQFQIDTQNHILKPLCCDTLAKMGVHVFERLPHDVRMKLIIMLSGYSVNEENVLRAAAVRTLAVYVLFPSLSDDFCFIENTAVSIIELMADTNRMVRFKASWALGNISDVLFTNKRESHVETISNELLKRMIETTIASADQSDNIRTNVMRTMGNLLYLFDEAHFENIEWTELFMRAINVLIVHGLNKGIYKVKWNTCYAIGNILKNSHIYRSKCCTQWQKLVFPNLCNLLLNCTNFKVRINAAIALAVPIERSHYGTHYLTVWGSLLTTLERTDEHVDFAEYKHRDDLIDQLCLTISHVLGLIIKEDLCSFANELVTNVDRIKEFWTRVVNRVLPEKVAPLLYGALKLNEFDVKNVNLEQRNALQTLRGCFVYNVEI